MAKVKIVNADVIEWAKNYRGEKFHALFCDAPYSLGDGKKGFMNKEWDNAIACNPDTWAALAEHLLPGAFLFVFAGTLNDDLISVAMRQAGLRKFHKTINWGFGSGFPKASRIDTQIDKAAGAKRKIVERKLVSNCAKAHKDGYSRIGGKNGYDSGKAIAGEIEITAPATPLAKTWAGHRYGLQAIKPAVETILLFQKPYDGKPVDSIVKNGSGALWVDGGRIAVNESDAIAMERCNTPGSGRFGKDTRGQIYGGGKGTTPPNTILDTKQGRWPANLILQHSPNCNGTCSPECVVREMDEQSGILKSGSGDKHNRKPSTFNASTDWLKYKGTSIGGDAGGASRFFFNADWNHEAAEQISNAAAVRYVAKASRRERDAGLENFRMINGNEKTGRKSNSVGLIGDKKYKGQTTNPYANGSTSKNLHPTVKPISLCKYLATLLLPPAAYAPRRIVIPFAGVASEVIGAMLAGWEEVTAVEKEKEYCDIGRARVKYWQNHKEPVAKKSKSQKVSMPQVAELFPEYE